MIDYFLNEESGQGMAEYALIIGLIGVALVVAAKVQSNSLQTSIEGSVNKMDDALNEACRSE